MKEHAIHIHIGARSIKTAAAATLCAFVYLLIGRNPTFACIGAVFGLGADMGSSWLNGGNRLIGTAIGGVLGMALFSLYLLVVPTGEMTLLILPLLFAAVLMLIALSLRFNWPGAVQPGSVVLCILFFATPVESYIPYALNRILDTGIGVAVSLLINVVLPHGQMLRHVEKLHLRWFHSQKA